MIPKHWARKTAPEEQTLHTETIMVERKTVVFTLKENPNGRFLKITEYSGQRHNTIIVPSSGLEDFRKLVEAMTREADEIQPNAP
jgi:hypothetical protein